MHEHFPMSSHAFISLSIVQHTQSVIISLSVALSNYFFTLHHTRFRMRFFPYITLSTHSHFISRPLIQFMLILNATHPWSSIRSTIFNLLCFFFCFVPVISTSSSFNILLLLFTIFHLHFSFFTRAHNTTFNIGAGKTFQKTMKKINCTNEMLVVPSASIWWFTYSHKFERKSDLFYVYFFSPKMKNKKRTSFKKTPLR